jgi:hypothetical protein
MLSSIFLANIDANLNIPKEIKTILVWRSEPLQLGKIEIEAKHQGKRPAPGGRRA